MNRNVKWRRESKKKKAKRSRWDWNGNGLEEEQRGGEGITREENETQPINSQK